MLNPAIHKKILLQILSDVYSDNLLGHLLGFKGGTAAYLFYGLDRFSVDLDFDLLDVMKEKLVFDQVRKIVGKYGKIITAEIKSFNLLFIFSYDQKVEYAQNVKIEINRRNFGSEYEVKSFLGISMLVMAQRDMFANKLIAMSERLGKTNRDIYDVCFFEKNSWPINKELVEKRAGMPYRKLVEQLIKRLSKISRPRILDGLGELLDEKQKAWVKAKLINETSLALKIALESENN